MCFIQAEKHTKKAPVIKAGKIKKIDICSAARFSLVQGIKHPLSNNVFIGLECKMKSFNLLSNKVLIGSMVQGIQLNLSNKVLIGSRSRFAHAAQNRIFILLCSFFPRTLRMLSNRRMYSLLLIFIILAFLSAAK